MKKPPTKRINLEYPARRIRQGIKARAIAIARVTDTLYIVDREHVLVTHSTGPTFGVPKLRFSRKTGEIVGQSNYRGRWRVVNP